jgi:hypothetical protein
MKAIKLIVIVAVLVGLNIIFVNQVMSAADASSPTTLPCVDLDRECKSKCAQSTAEVNSQPACLESCKEIAVKCMDSDENKAPVTKILIWGVLSGCTTIAIIFTLYLLLKLGIMTLFSARSNKDKQ